VKAVSTMRRRSAGRTVAIRKNKIDGEASCGNRILSKVVAVRAILQWIYFLQLRSILRDFKKNPIPYQTAVLLSFLLKEYRTIEVCAETIRYLSFCAEI